MISIIVLVTRLIVSHLLKLIENMCYIYERSRSVGINESTSTYVKGPNFILSSLRYQNNFIKVLVKAFPDLKDVENSLDLWIEKLDKNYKEQNDTTSELPEKLTFEDGLALSDDARKWIDTIIQVYAKPVTSLINRDKLSKFIPASSFSKLDKIGKADLRDGINLIEHGFPTSASVMLFRVGEKIIQKYYKKITKQIPTGLTWGRMIDNLKQNPNANQITLGYLAYLNKKRIDVAHPYRRYTQEESEMVLMHIKNILDEI